MTGFVMEGGECQPVILKPFIHQVGGHTSMLKFDETSVCKPLVAREHHFYQCLPSEMKEFSPQYRGVADVAYQEDSSGRVNLVAYPIVPKSSHRKHGQASTYSSLGSNAGSESRDELSSSSSAHSQVRNGLRQTRRVGIVENGNKICDAKVAMEGAPDNGLLQVRGHNPWQLKCQKRTLDKMRKNGQGKKTTTKFIILENLIWHFEVPCVLDLKMGTRQHGDDATEEKRLLHSSKCETTTSGKLGARLCGMQVFQADTRQYICHDKYLGRAIGEQGFRDCLYQFLHNGCGLRTDVLDCVVERLQCLKAMLSKQNTFRFYSSSLLIMYDGCLGPGIVHLAAPLRDPPLPSNFSQESDFELPYDSTESRDDTGPHEEALWDDIEISEDKYVRNPSKIPKKSSPMSSVAMQLRVDVRMIDFAHVTHQGFHGDCIVHHGPDHGYLLGLQSLIEIFERIKQQYISLHA